MKKQLFDEYATFTTKDNRTYNIQKERIYIGGKSDYYGKLYIITSDDKSKDMHVIDEIYSFDNNRLRFLEDIYSNTDKFKTIEHSQNNSIDRPITVVRDYETRVRELNSIGDIKEFHSDLMDYHTDTIIKEKDNNLLKRLILK